MEKTKKKKANREEIMQKLNTLRKTFKHYNIEGYIVPKNDEFFGEYISDSRDRLKFISSFTGSAGYALILKKKSYLFVDGRYTLQAFKESGKKFKIVEIYKKKPSNIIDKLKKRITIGYDPQLLTKSTINNLFASSKCNLKLIQENLVDKIWNKKNKIQIKRFYILPEGNMGESYKSKIKRTIIKMKSMKVDKLLITAPENIAWLMNIRGGDSKFSPIPNCNAVLNLSGEIDLIVDERKINKKFIGFFKKKIRIISRHKIINYLINSKNKKNKFCVDLLTCSIFYEKLLENLQIPYICKLDPIYFLKSIKNNKEILDSKKSHIFDGVALTKFIYWIKSNIKKSKISELSAQKKLENFRKKNRYYKFIIRSDPYSVKSVNRLLRKFKKNITIIKGNSNDVLKQINLDEIDYVFLDGGHKYETVRNDLKNLTQVVNNKGTILCDDYNLTYAPGVKKAIDEYALVMNFDLKIYNLRFAEITKKNSNL